jgi:7,8-dihydro-6-hydroxymethylpterin dimethyltransferase
VPILSPEEVHARQPYALPDDGLTPLERARRRVAAAGQWHDLQALGRRFAIGCVALEITQRCNLDCTLCYLSESSEALKDIPLAEVFRRIDMIHDHYGPGTDIQVTGGDPTLRDRAELVAIVKRIRDRGMRASLFTNGIKASRELLAELASVGLTDVAFHVDLTQERNGYESERALNALRLEYIERVRGLPLSVFFNTTVFDRNVREVPEVVRFFVAHHDVVRLASFQLQAASGRGVLGERSAPLVTPDSVARLIGEGAGTPIGFGAPGAGHHDCNRYAFTLVVGGRVYDPFADRKFFARMLDAMGDLYFPRSDRRRALEVLGRWLIAHPFVMMRTLPWAARQAWALRRDLVRARGRVGKMSFFIHNFMDACHLERDRIDACNFMVATPDGPMSMCLHNAKRDDYLVRPIAVRGAGEPVRFWNPVSGRFSATVPTRIEVRHTRKTARGRAKAALARPVVDAETTDG